MAKSASRAKRNPENVIVPEAVSDDRDLIDVKVYDGLLLCSELGEDWVAAALAGVGSFVE